LIAQGEDPQVAREKALAAQEYLGKNTANILAGTGLGAFAAGTGVEKAIGERIAAKIGTEAATEAAKKEVAEGIGMRVFKGAGAEALPEGLQAGQSQFATNIALSGEGVETPAFQGVIGSAARDALTAGILGGTVSAPRPARAATPEAPIEVPPKDVTPPTEEAPPTPPKDLDKDFLDYYANMPEGSEIVFQNRDRSTQASIAQMQSIAAKPDYSRVSESKDFANGAPVVISDISLEDSPTFAVTGKKSEATLSNGEKIPVMYAVVEAGSLLPSNSANGSTNNNYTDLTASGLRPIAGNGRVAGISEAYQKGTADQYKDDLIKDAQNLGIDPDTISEFKKPSVSACYAKSILDAKHCRLI
jgi:hypothetical protein